MIDSLMDMINQLKLDVYKCISIDEINDFRFKINRKVYQDTEIICDEIMRQNPFKPHQFQPEHIRFVLPPVAEVLDELNISAEEEEKEAKRLNEKRKDETLINFGYSSNRLLAIYEKGNNYIYYMYDYDYLDRHDFNLMSRVEYINGKGSEENEQL